MASTRAQSVWSSPRAIIARSSFAVLLTMSPSFFTPRPPHRDDTDRSGPPRPDHRNEATMRFTDCDPSPFALPRRRIAEASTIEHLDDATVMSGDFHPRRPTEVDLGTKQG